MDELITLRLILVCVVIGLLLICWMCRSIVYKSIGKKVREMVEESKKKIKKRPKKKSSSSDNDSGSDKNSEDQTDHQNDQVVSSDDVQPRTSKKKKALVHVDSSASDLDTQTST